MIIIYIVKKHILSVVLVLYTYLRNVQLWPHRYFRCCQSVLLTCVICSNGHTETSGVVSPVGFELKPEPSIGGVQSNITDGGACFWINLCRIASSIFYLHRNGVFKIIVCEIRVLCSRKWCQQDHEIHLLSNSSEIL